MGKRIYYACQGLAYDGELLRGVQSVSTNSNIQQYNHGIFGKLGVFTAQDNPDVKISVVKIFGGDDLPIFGTGSLESKLRPDSGKDLCLEIGVENWGTILGEGNPTGLYGSDTVDLAELSTTIGFSGVLIEAAAYSLQADGSLTESIDFVGYHREVNASGLCSPDIFERSVAIPSGLPTLVPVGGNIGGAGISRRQHVKNHNLGASNLIGFDIQTSFTRQPVSQFGKGYIDPEYTYVITPIETSFSYSFHYSGGFDPDRQFDVNYNSCSGDYLNPASSNNWFIEMCNNIKFNINNCYYQGTTYGGGDTGGGNVEVTYNYTCYDGFSITSSG